MHAVVEPLSISRSTAARIPAEDGAICWWGEVFRLLFCVSTVTQGRRRSTWWG